MLSDEQLAEIRRRILLDPDADINAFACHVNEDVRALLTEVRQLTENLKMHVSIRLEIEKILDVALGPNEEDGAGAGLVGDVALLADRVRQLTEDRDRARAEAERQRKRAENAEAGVMKHAKQVDQVTASHEQMKTRLREAEEIARDLEEAQIADRKAWHQAEAEVKQLRERLNRLAGQAEYLNQIGAPAHAPAGGEG